LTGVNGSFADHPINMKNLKSTGILSIFFFIALLALSCKKENEKPYILISPEELRQFADPGEVVTYNITVKSSEKLNKFRIYLIPENQFETLYLDSNIATSNFSFRFQFQVPSQYTGKLIELRFNAIDEAGNTVDAIRQIQVGDILLTLYTAQQMATYPNLNGNAYNLQLLQNESSSIADSSVRDLQEYSLDTTSQSPSKIWFSPAGGKFVKSNNFDFGNASFGSAKAAFESSIQADFTDSLVPNDIYIHKILRGSSPDYTVIKIVAINDSLGIAGDYYLFDIKK